MNANRHTLLIAGRLLLAAGIMLALPYAHVHWGVSYPGDGQQAFGVVLLLAVVGAAVAFGYVLVASVVQIALRRKSWWWTAATDASLSLLLAAFLIYLGMHVRYSEDGGQADAAEQENISGFASRDNAFFLIC